MLERELLGERGGEVGGDLGGSGEVCGDLSCGELGQEVLLGVWGSDLCSFCLFFSADSWPEAARFLVRWLDGKGALLVKASLIWVAMSPRE